MTWRQTIATGACKILAQQTNSFHFPWEAATLCRSYVLLWAPPMFSLTAGMECFITVSEVTSCFWRSGEFNRDQVQTRVSSHAWTKDATTLWFTGRVLLSAIVSWHCIFWLLMKMHTSMLWPMHFQANCIYNTLLSLWFNPILQFDLGLLGLQYKTSKQ